MSNIKKKDRIKDFLRMDKAAIGILIKEYKEKLRNFRFDLAAGKVKDVREIRDVKKDIARLNTINKQK